MAPRPQHTPLKKLFLRSPRMPDLPSSGTVSFTYMWQQCLLASQSCFDAHIGMSNEKQCINLISVCLIDSAACDNLCNPIFCSVASYSRVTSTVILFIQSNEVLHSKSIVHSCPLMLDFCYHKFDCSARNWYQGAIVQLVATNRTHPWLVGIQIPELDMSVANCHKAAAVFCECYAHNLQEIFKLKLATKLKWIT